MNDDTPPRDSELAARFRAETRAHRLADESEALHHRWSSRHLVTVAKEAMQRGDTVALHMPGDVQVTGKIAACGRDYAIIDSSWRTAARLPDVEGGDHGAVPPTTLTVTHRAKAGGTRGERRPASLVGLLRDLELREIAPIIGTLLHPHGLAGELRAVAVDHVHLHNEDGADVHVPLSAVVYARWREEQPRLEPTERRDS